MAGAIKNLEHLKTAINNLIEKRRLFVYVLFDERASQQKVADFLDKRFDWLNSLADSSNVYILFFLRGDVKGIGRVVQAVGEIQNPSLQVARWFEIQPKELPGIVIFLAYKTSAGGFAISSEYEFTEGIFLPLKTELFSDNSDHLEEVFADLFSILQKHQSEFDPAVPDNAVRYLHNPRSYINIHNMVYSNEFIQGIGKDVNKLRRAMKMRPFIQYLEGGVKNVAKLPSEFLTSLAVGFGTELAKTMTGKNP